jgi:hypothetical protein
MEQNSKPVTLENAAYRYSKSKSENRYESNFDSFVAGAQWQKERDKEMLNLLIEIKNKLYPSIGEIHVQLFDKIREAIIKHNS